MTLMRSGDWLTVKEVSKILGVKLRQAQVYVKTGRIPSKCFGHWYLVYRSDAEAFVPRKRGRPRLKPPDATSN